MSEPLSAAAEAEILSGRPKGAPPAPLKGRLILAASIVLVAFNMRAALSSIGPVLPEAMRGTGLGPSESSLLTTVPVVLLGLFGLLAPAFARRLGSERAVLAFMLVLALGLAMRAAGDAVMVIAGCVLGGAGIGVVNVLLPGIIKRDFPDRAPLLTGLYTMGLVGGAAIAAGATAPLQKALHGRWEWALAFWAIPALVAALVWTLQLSRHAETAGQAQPRVVGLWRDRLAWQVTIFTGLQSCLAYSIFAWLAPILRDRGLGQVEAGLVVSVSVMVQVVSALLGPLIATRGRDQRPAVIVTVGLSAVGLAGCLWGPLASVWLWAVVMGLGQGAVFAIALTVIVLRAPDAAVAARLSSMAQGVGYSLASAGPLLIGLSNEWTGDWGIAGVLLVVITLVAGVAGVLAGRDLLVSARSLPPPPSGRAAA